MCITCDPNYFHHLQQYVAIENPIRIMKYATGIAKNIFIIEINKIHKSNFLSAIMFNILTTGKSINFQLFLQRENTDPYVSSFME